MLPAITRRGVATCAALALCAAGLAHVRLHNPSNGNALFWSTPSNVPIVISSAGSADISDGSHFTALRMALDTWNDVTGTSARLVEDTSPSQQARTDWDDLALNMILFDEDNSSGYFPPGSSTVALTPVWFFNDGEIAGADVLFNGEAFRFTTSGEANRFDVQDVATHELGHLLGLDHTGWASGTMYPYVDREVLLHRSLGLDELHGVRDAYPSGSYSTIRGTVERSADSSPVAGAHVVARDADGRTAASCLSESDGRFWLRGLDGGTYEVYADPLDAPVSAVNLGAGWTIETDFESTVHGSVAVSSGGTTNIGVLAVEPDAGVSLGENVDLFPLRCVAGTTASHTLRGSGLADGSTLTCSDPDVTISAVTWFGTQVSFDVTVPAGEAPGHADLTATKGNGRKDILVAAIEITPRDPAVLLVSPNQGQDSGGASVTITGTGFRAGARVVIGGNVYEDGQPNGCSVVDGTTITLETLPTTAGIWDVVVVDASGVEGRLQSGFQFLDVPTITSAFPSAGQAAGGTAIVIRGGNFDAQTLVRIDGVLQGQVELVDQGELVVTTQAGVAGGPYAIQVESAGGQSATLAGAFSYVAAPDPLVTAVEPATGDVAGGETVVVRGANFRSDASVTFGADEGTGAGGTPAAGVTFVDAGELLVVTPGFAAAGSVNVLVGDPSGQAHVLVNGFLLEESTAGGAGGGGGGGGGCYTIPVDGPRGPRALLQALFWLALILLGLRGLAPRPAARRAAR